MHDDPLTPNDGLEFGNPYQAPKEVRASDRSPSLSDVTSWPITFKSSITDLTGVIIPGILGVVLLGFGLLMFLANLFILHGGQIALHLSTTAPCIGGVFSLMAAWSNRRATREVRLWPQGIELIARETQTVAWQNIHSVRVADSTNPGTMAQKVITLAGVDNEPIGRISGAFKDHDDLVRQVRAMAGVTEPTEGSRATVSAAGKKKGRRTALITGFGALLLGTAGVFLPLQAYWEHQAVELLANQGVVGTGTVTERLIAPNGHTHRIHYDVTGTDGTVESHNVEVTPEFYAGIAVGDPVAVRYVPDRPDVCELVSGEVRNEDITDNPIVMVLLGLFGIVATLFMIPMTVLSWKGYDVDFAKGKFKIVALE